MMTIKGLNNAWVVRKNPRPDAGLRLFCFPYAGGSASIFNNWSDYFPDAVEIVGVQSPGRGRRVKETPFTQIKPLVESAKRALLPLMDRPYGVFGQSAGAMVGFVFARELSQDGFVPKHLFVSGCRAPHLPKTDPPIHALPEPEFISAIQRLKQIPNEILEHDEMMRLIIPTLRSDFALSETFAEAEIRPVHCPITAFGGLSDDIVEREDLEAWRKNTCAAFNIYMFPGDHFFLQTSQDVLLQTIKLELQSDKIGF